MDSEKSINLFKIKKEKVTWLFIEQFFCYWFVNNFSGLLLCKINILDIFSMDNFFHISYIRNNESRFFIWVSPNQNTSANSKITRRTQ